MNKTLYTEDQILIEASVDRVWSVLTESDETVKYMYGCEVDSDWNEGSDVLWTGREDKVLYVKGKLVKFDKNRAFIYTVIDPNGPYEDLPENHLTVSCLLEKKGKTTLLKTTQGDYASVADGKTRYQHSVDGGGWSSVLEQIKKVAEGRTD